MVSVNARESKVVNLINANMKGSKFYSTYRRWEGDGLPFCRLLGGSGDEVMLGVWCGGVGRRCGGGLKLFCSLLAADFVDVS